MKLYSLFISIIFFNLNFTNDKLPQGFVYLNDIAPDIKLDLRYFSTNNFVGEPIDGYLGNKCIISIEAAKALVKVQHDLGALGYGLKVFDTYRPQQAVGHFVRWAEDIKDIKMKHIYYPDIEKRYLFQQGYISSKSGHTRGSTVDLTIIYTERERKDNELDMGTPWDFFSPKSWPSSDEVTDLQKSNRMLLQKVMMKHGFQPIKEEWWHFTLKEEPFPDTYFNFPVE